ncbi:MAG TPA: methionyl-tRNA formyltransferase [Candidatus Limnocylindrales bacterium]|jgi:methionyl-tRNA formyltransferase
MTAERQAGPRIAFFGSGPFAVPILDALASVPGAAISTVVTVPDRPAGRSGRLTAPPVAERARELDLMVLQPRRLADLEVLEAVGALNLDAAVLADYGRLVPPALLALPRRGFLNVHPSALPRHRGATPIQATIAAGDPEAAVTLFEMDATLDTGPIVAQEAWRLSGRETAPELEVDAAARGAALLQRELEPWLAGRRPSRPQSTAGASLTRPLAREDGRLDPTEAAVVLERRVRALLPWPGTFIETGPERLLVIRAAVAPAQPGDRPGRLVADDGGLALATVDGRLRLLEVRPAGGRSMSGDDLRRGRPGLAGSAVAGRPELAVAPR